MFSLLDFIFTIIIKITTILGFGITKPRLREVIINNNEKISSFYFLPLATRKNNYLFKKIVKKSGTSYIYGLNALYHMDSNTKISIERLDETYKTAKKDIEEALKRNNKINIFGQSLGTPFAVRLVSEYKCEKLTIIVPGDKLGECAWESWLVGINARKSGLKKEKYCEAYRKYDPERYAKKLKAKLIKIYLSGVDLLIPAKRGRRIAKLIKKFNKNTKIKSWWFSDHLLAIILSAGEIGRENEGKNNSIYPIK